ncbi:major facilitator superfamily domain-containing protein 4A-like isoform X2 [Haliotis asinina]|uniref:major facilitator superfamily domain-containing protein 4A-like isoform X2 n=1 Tax=Haliotis asinina TaxID=109174 RepID=UPI00353254A1
MAACCSSSAMGNFGVKFASCPNMELSVILAVLCFNGMADSILGPSLDDLRCIFFVSVQTISILVPLSSGLKTAGCMFYAPLHAPVNAYTLMIVCVIVISCLVLAIPLCSSFWLAAAASSGTGLAGGVLVTGATSKIGELSQGSAVPLHMMALALCIGNVLGALVVAPFLNDTVRHGNTSVLQDLDMTSFECGDSDSNIDVNRP